MSIGYNYTPYFLYSNPARNNPTITATILITFFNAYPIKTPAKKPPPRVAAVGPKLSMLIIYNSPYK